MVGDMRLGFMSVSENGHDHLICVQEVGDPEFGVFEDGDVEALKGYFL